MQRKNIVKRVLYLGIPVLVICLGLVFYFWFHYSNKYNLIKRYNCDGTKNVYILGTIGEKHFNRLKNYSMEDVINAINKVNPDIVLLTAREDHYKLQGVVDGDIATCVAYSYCLENQIPIKMIDWWMIDNIYPKSATTNLRDDNIFIKISRVLKEVHSGTKVLIITDSKNFHEQIARFDVAGMKEIKLHDKKDFFKNKNNDQEFKYPPLASKVWKDRSYFYAYTLAYIIKDNDFLNDDIKKRLLNFNNEKFYRSQINYCSYLLNNILY